MNTVGERLKKWSDSHYKYSKDLADALHVPPSTLSAYFKNRRTPASDMQQKLRELGCDIEWLMTGKENNKSGWEKVKKLPPAMQLPNIGENVEIPMLLSPVSAGNPKQGFDEVGAYMKPARYFNKNTFAIQATGESMVGAGIREGEWLIVDTDREPIDGSIVIARIGDELTVKRLRANGGQFLLHPENNRYKPVPVGDDVEVLAVVLSAMQLF